MPKHHATCTATTSIYIAEGTNISRELCFSQFDGYFMNNHLGIMLLF